MVGTSTDPVMFSPGAAATRGTILTVLHRMAGSPDASNFANPFGDVAPGAWYADAVTWAAAIGIVAGVADAGLPAGQAGEGSAGEGSFDPNAPITRQDLVAMLSRYADHMGMTLPTVRDYPGFIDDADIANYAKEAIERFFRAQIIGGYPDGDFKPQGEATRA